MSVTKKSNGEFLVRLQLPTSERGANGKVKYKNTTKSFPTKGAAEAWEKKKKGESSELGTGGIITQSQLSEYKESKKLSRGNDLREVVAFWLLHHPEGEILTVKQVWEKYKESREFGDYKPKTKYTKKSGILQFCEDFGDSLINEISLQDVEAYLDRFDSEITRNTKTSSIRTMFKWAAHRKQGYLTINQLKYLEHCKVSFKQPEIISTADVTKVFEKCAEIMPNMIPFIALQFFAGIRTSEVAGDRSVEHSGLEARDFDFEDKTIYIRPEVAKTKGKGKEAESARLLENLPDTLWAWLDAVGFEGNIDVTGYGERLSKLFDEAKVKRPNNVGRHCFASYAYALMQDAGKVRKWTGHSNTDTIFKRHYAHQGLKQKHGETYFGIKPDGQIKVSPPKGFKGATSELSDMELLKKSKTMTNVDIGKL